MLRRTPFKTKRRAKPQALKDFHGVVAQMACEVCYSYPVEVHHVRWDGRKSISRDHKLVIALCPICHRTGEMAVHVVGNQAFEFLHAIKQHALATRNWEKFNG